MKRRQVFSIVGIGVGVSGGYFAWDWYQSPPLPAGLAVDTRYIQGNAFGEPAQEHRDLGPREEYHRIIRNEETAADEIEFNDSVVEFAEETDFSESSLIVVQTAMQTNPDLALESISRTNDGLSLDVTVEHPWWRGDHDDLGTHSLLIRTTDEKDDSLESVSVDIDGYV